MTVAHVVRTFEFIGDMSGMVPDGLLEQFRDPQVAILARLEKLRKAKKKHLHVRTAKTQVLRFASFCSQYIFWIS